MAPEWPKMTLEAAGVDLIDCLHKTPPDAGVGFPYVAIPQMTEGRIGFEGVRRITAQQFSEWTAKANPKAHDVLLSRRCNPGTTAYVPPGMRFAVGQNLVLLRADGSKVHPPFLRWWVSSPAWWEEVGRFINVGAVFDSLRCRDVPKFVLPLPPLDEQRRIAAILGALDNKIELNRRMNRTLEDIAQTLFKSWFIDFDGHDDLVDSEIGPIPRGWKVGKIGDVCRAIFSGGTPRTSEAAFWNGPHPWLSSGETGERFILGTIKTITQAGIERSSTRLAPAGATVVASAGQGKTRGQTAWLGIDAYINQSTVALVANDAKVGASWLFLNLIRRYDEMRQLSDSHSSRGSLTTKLLAGMPAVIPNTERGRQFETVARPLIDRATGGRREAMTLAHLRDTLLPKLISGEIRVPEAESAMSEVL